MYVASIFGYYEYIEINAFITGSMAIGIILVLIQQKYFGEQFNQ